MAEVIIRPTLDNILIPVEKLSATLSMLDGLNSETETYLQFGVVSFKWQNVQRRRKIGLTYLSLTYDVASSL